MLQTDEIWSITGIRKEANEPMVPACSELNSFIEMINLTYFFNIGLSVLNQVGQKAHYAPSQPNRSTVKAYIKIVVLIHLWNLWNFYYLVTLELLAFI